jgi:Na+-driven multidrug efflux pump
LPALLLSMIVDCLTGPTNPVLQAMNMENTHSRVLLAFIPVQFGAVYLFGTVAGIEGAGIAFLVSRCLWNVVVFARIYQVRGLVMLPYLDVTRAFGADSPGSEGKTSQRQCRQSRWQAVASPEVSASDVRAA